MDMSQTITARSDQINYDDFAAGPRDITVTRVSGNENADQPVNIYFQGDNGKPYRPCLSMRRVLVACWGADATTYVGKTMRLYGDPDVTFGGAKVGGIRISHLSHIPERRTMALTATRAKRKPYTVEPLSVQMPDESDLTDEEALDLAKEHAAKGKDAFLRWYNSDEGKSLRDLIKPHMNDLKALCETADATADPFDNPDETPTLTPEEEDRIRREIDDEHRKQAEGA